MGLKYEKHPSFLCFQYLNRETVPLRPRLLYFVCIILLLLLQFPDGGRASESDKANQKTAFSDESVKTSQTESAIKPNKLNDFDLENLENDIDIVGYGEDCSPEGPLCDVDLHLTCDSTEEICVCDVKSGYIHENDVLGTESWGFHSSGGVCISVKDVEGRALDLLGLSENHGERNRIVNDDSEWSEVPTIEEVEKVEGDGEEQLSPFNDSTPENFLGSGTTYDTIMKNLEDSGKLDGMKEVTYDEDRLKRFKLTRSPVADLSMEELVFKEIMKYVHNSVEIKTVFGNILKVTIPLGLVWRSHPLSKSFCERTLFDVDLDGVLTHQEYVIALLSPTIRSLLYPRAFLDLIGPLVEVNCISLEDIRQLDHYPETLQNDFDTFDINGDRCFSLVEFEDAMNSICRADWLTEFAKDIYIDFSEIDPQPEEMFIRRLLQNERLNANWKLVDINQDELISLSELQKDLAIVGVGDDDGDDDDGFRAATLMKHIDKDMDGMVSKTEIKLQVSVPEFTQEYQYEWIESLYELFETDESDVAEYLQIVIDQYTDGANDKQANDSKIPVHRLFRMFDRNRNGEIDEVELRLLMEIMKKYVVYITINMTMSSIDLDEDGKISVYEFQEFFAGASEGFKGYMKSLVYAVDEDGELIEDDDETDYDEDYGIKSAGNDTVMAYKLFKRLDANSNSFLTKEDLRHHLYGFKTVKSEAEIKREFFSLDTDQDGVISSKDVADMGDTTMTFEEFSDSVQVYSEVIDHKSVFSNMAQLDSNRDSVVDLAEFTENKLVLLDANDDEEFVDWVEDYFGKVTAEPDLDGEKAFKEFDSNSDGFVAQAEFALKLDELHLKASSHLSAQNIYKPSERYFQCLDLDKNDKVSYNEFQFLLLRSNKAHIK